jgi:hypothetical protein
MGDKNRLGEIWVETIIYTLIAFVLIGAVLAIAQPKIEQIQDKAFIEQSAGVIKEIDNLLFSLEQGGVGNKRLIELGIKKGSLKIDGENDLLFFEIDSSYMYSEPGANIFEGDIIIHTRKKADAYVVNISQNYPNYNITLGAKDEIKILNKASTPYQLLISHNGKDSSNKIIINFEIK